ncbi:phage tail domain-containing protein, partial [Cronobacter sakazakii]|uniref:phage tail domain-containing protein n=1 Tax=Cronobacter sakazakii TaxID=28141 RepID=UPI001A98AA0F
ILMGFSRPAWSPVERDILKVPSKPGGYFLQTNVDVRTIEVPVIIRSGSVSVMQKVERRFSGLARNRSTMRADF